MKKSKGEPIGLIAMKNNITAEELCCLEKLINTQDNMIMRIEQSAKAIREPRLKIEYRKLYSAACNNKQKLLSVLE
ncbi:MAG: hypothetical protein ACI4RC_00650 [Oscillospiraceae bacterium]